MWDRTKLAGWVVGQRVYMHMHTSILMWPYKRHTYIYIYICIYIYRERESARAYRYLDRQIDIGLEVGVCTLCGNPGTIEH